MSPTKNVNDEEPSSEENLKILPKKETRRALWLQSVAAVAASAVTVAAVAAGRSITCSGVGAAAVVKLLS